MSKLFRIRKALKENTSIDIVRNRDINYNLPLDGSWNQLVHFIIAPKEEISDVKLLQDLMMSLIPGLEPTMVSPFRDTGSGMDVGKLSFKENIGTEKVHRTLKLTDEDLLGMEGFINGESTIITEIPMQCCTLVHLYPSKAVAEFCFEDAPFSADHIDKRILKRFLGKK